MIHVLLKVLPAKPYVLTLKVYVTKLSANIV